METYTAILLLIIPGFISREIYKSLNSSYRKESDFRETVIALIYSVFIMILNYSTIIAFELFSKNELWIMVNAFNRIEFIIYYVILTLLSSLFIGILWNLINPLFVLMINYARKFDGKNEILNAESLFLASFNDGKKHLIALESNGEIKTGIIEKFDIIDGCVKNICLFGQDEFNDVNFKEISIKGVYPNLLGENTKITEYEYQSNKVNKKHAKRVIFWLITILGILGLIIGVSFLYKTLFN